MNQRGLMGCCGILMCGVMALAFAPFASAGGSWLYPDQERYEPGESATIAGQFGGGMLGTMDDGPFFAYLRVDPEAAVAEPDEDALWSIHHTDLPLGRIAIEDGDALRYRGTLTFTIPETAPGLYSIVYCNDPCTEGIGDLIGATIAISHDHDYPLMLQPQEEGLDAGPSVPPTVVRRTYSTLEPSAPTTSNQELAATAIATASTATESTGSGSGLTRPVIIMSGFGVTLLVLLVGRRRLI